MYAFGNMGHFKNKTVSFDFKQYPVLSFITFNGVNTTNTFCEDNGIAYLPDLEYDKWNLRILSLGYGTEDFGQDKSGN